MNLWPDHAWEITATGRDKQGCLSYPRSRFPFSCELRESAWKMPENVPSGHVDKRGRLSYSRFLPKV
jgi:hypothetical protein